MTPEQYEKVGQLFHAALELPPDRRSAFLSGACRRGRRPAPRSGVAAPRARPGRQLRRGSAGDGGRAVAAASGRAGAGQRTHRRLRRAVADRPWRDGGSLPGPRHQAWPQRRGEAAAVRAHEQSRRGQAVRAGSARRLVAEPSEHRDDPRDRRPARAPLHCDGAGGRVVARGDGRSSARGHRAGADWRAAGTGALGRARCGHRPSRHQARERHRARRRLRQGARLRVGAPRAGAHGRPGRRRDESQPAARHPALHVAGAGARRDRDRRQRCVLARRRPLRARHRCAPVRVGVHARDAARDHLDPGAEPAALGAGHAGAARAAVAVDARQGGGGAADGGGGRGGAGAAGGWHAGAG